MKGMDYGESRETLTTSEVADKLDLPERIVVGANGAYWRDYGDHYSMCPVSDDNDPVEPVAVYVRAGRGVDLRQSLERRSRAYHAAVHVKFPGSWEECPLSECFWDVSAIKMASARAALDAPIEHSDDVLLTKSVDHGNGGLVQ